MAKELDYSIDRWVVQAIAICAWESIAIASGRRVPTVSNVVRRTRKRYPKSTTVALALWLIALAKHFHEAP